LLLAGSDEQKKHPPPEVRERRIDRNGPPRPDSLRSGIPRCTHQEDFGKARHILPFYTRVAATNEQMAPIQDQFAKAQIPRLYVANSNAATGPLRATRNRGE